MSSRQKLLTLALVFLSASWVPNFVSAQQNPGQGSSQDMPAPTPPGQSGAALPTPAPATNPDEAVQAPADLAAAPPAGDKQQFGETMVVTGSRIRRKDLTTPAPVTVLSREQVQASGKVSIGDFLQSLPEQGNAINTAVNNGGDGATRVALRGLGSARTLVLVNGRRWVPGGTGADSSVDLNSIPTAAIERIEVLKDGASAVYGSDAIGGVVNIITRRKFEGVDLNAFTAQTSHGDGLTYDLNATTGAGGERGNILFSAGFFKQQSIMADARRFSQFQRFFDATGANGGDGPTTEYLSGSGTIPAGRVVIPAGERGVPNGNALWNSLVTASGNTTSGSFIRDPTATATGGWRRYLGSTLPEVGGDGYNFQPENYLLTPQQRVSLYSAGDLNVGNFARGYFEASYVNRQSNQNLAPEPLLTDGEGLTISRNNVYNPFGRDFSADLGAGVRRRLLEFGRRVTAQDLDTFRVVGGLDGTLSDAFGPAKGWFWDVSFNYGRNAGTQLKNGNLRLPRLQDAVGPSFRDSTGVARCGTPGAPIAGCVPLDLFGGPGSITPDQVRGLTYTGTLRGLNQMFAFQVNSSGELFRLLSDRPLGLAVGYEYRTNQGQSIPDPVTVAGETSGNKGEITSGGYFVNEGYAELSVPLLGRLPLVEDLEATAAVRVSDYSTFGTNTTYKFGGRYTPVRDFTVRGTYSTAFRAPSISDLFFGIADNFASVQDPCAGAAAGTPLAAQCGAAAGNGDDQTQLRSQVGGNPRLQPETAKIFTVGAVFEPSFFKNFTATVDYYKIDIDKNIGVIGENVILAGCYPGAAGTPNQAYCNLISRNPASQRITNILNLNANVGSESTAGIDLALRYTLPTQSIGRFGFVIDATWLRYHDQVLANGDVIRGRGTFDLQQVGAGTGGVFPTFKANAGVNWGLGGLGLGVATRFLGSYTECGDPDGNFAGGGLCYQDSTYRRQVDAYNTWDAFVSYGFKSAAGRTSLGVGVNNVFDKTPAIVYNGFTANTDPTAYDVAGRYLYFRIGQSF
jgi:outer membrane receptor protein involved in Fe transport